MRRSRLALLSAFLLCTGPVLGDEPPVAVRFDLRLDREAPCLEGEGTLRLRHEGEGPLEELALVLYPARFRVLDPGIVDWNIDRYYAPRFEPGDLRLLSLRDAAGRRLEARPAEDPGWPAGTLVRVRLLEPVAPGAWTELALGFRLDIPDRLGAFGRRGERIVLEGGALPYVPEGEAAGPLSPGAAPLPCAFDLSLELVGEAEGGREAAGEDASERAELLLGTRPLREQRDAEGRVRFVARTPFLAAGSDLGLIGERTGVGDAPGVRVYGEAGDAKRAGELATLAQSAGSFLRRRYLAPGTPPGEVVFVQAPLRDRFAAPAGQVVLYSDRWGHVFPLLEPFHELVAALAVVEALIQQALRGLPLGPDRDWVCEGLAWVVTREWFGSRAFLEGGQIRGALDWLSFIPSVDRVLRAPRFPGSDLYYGLFFEPVDAVPDGFARALSRRSRGRLVIEKLREKLGNEGLATLVRETLGPGSPGRRAAVRARAMDLASEELSAFFALWLAGPPAQDLVLDAVEELGDGEVEVRIRRTGDLRAGAVGEPVVVQGGKERAVWDGRGPEGRVRLKHDPWLFDPIVLDPRGRVWQTIQGGDVSPQLPVKILLNRFRLRVDLNEGNRNEAAVGLTLHPFYNYAHAVRLDGFYEEDERGVLLGYRYGFGKVIDERTFGASIGGRVLAARLTEGVVQDEAMFQETRGELITLGLDLGFDTRIFQLNPTWGLGASLGIEHSSRLYGSDFRFLQFSGALTGIYSFVRGTQLAGQLILGQTIARQTPTQRLFDAGGENTIRGVRTSRFLGPSIAVFRSEFRQMLVEDLDVNLGTLAWMRKLQAVAFVDFGDVGESIEAIWEARTDWKWGVGGGLRLWLDLFGVNPFVFRFDLGFRVDDSDAFDEEYYVGLGQSF